MRRLWSWFVRAMTSRCQRRKKMMGRGADGGCGTEEKPCRISRVPATIPAKEPVNLQKETLVGVDLFSQATKALSERSPFDTEEASASSVPTLPSGLASFLSKYSDSRKRHKKSHSGAEKKSSTRPGRGSSIWNDTEECFRELTVLDIDTLFEVSTFRHLANRNCLSVPLVGNSSVANLQCSDAVSGAIQDGVGLENGLVLKEEENKGDEHVKEIDNAGHEVVLQEEKGCSLSQPLESTNGLEWILGSKGRFILTSERPSKKRKLLGEKAGLEKVLVGCPCQGNPSLCHFCCQGDMGEQLNRLMVCRSCKVAVHRKCYGEQNEVVESWQCSWCKHWDETENALGSDYQCVLCPKKGGALKPVNKSAVDCGSGGSLEFSHLFCSLWMPEVYVEDVEKMEPIMNVDGIKETRKKLICSICKVKYGACVRCSNGACRTSFHPICAREASHRIEVWGKFGCDNVELRAYCLKHSEVLDNNGTQIVGQLPVADGSVNFVTKRTPVRMSVNRPHKLKIGRKNGDKLSVHIDTTDANSDNLGDNEPQKLGLLDTGVPANLRSENDDVTQLSNMEKLERKSSEEINESGSRNFALVLKKLIDGGKVNAKDVALEIGMSPDSLDATLSVLDSLDDRLVPELQSKIVKWLRSHSYVGCSQNNLKVKLKSTISLEAEIGEADADSSDAVAASESDISDHVSVKSVPPWRRTKSSIRILKDNNILCSSKEMHKENGMLVDEVKIDHVSKAPDGLAAEVMPETTEKILAERVASEDCLESEGDPAKPSNCSLSESSEVEEAGKFERTTLNCDRENPTTAVAGPVVSDLACVGVPGSLIHPSISDKLMQMQRGMLSKDTNEELDGPMARENIPTETSGVASVCCDHQNRNSTCLGITCKYGVNTEQLSKVKEMGILETSPDDEVEGELTYFQHRLISSAVTRKWISDNIICNIVNSLPKEIDTVRNQRWDSVMVNQYLYDVREAKKQGRKERRHKEAQAVLAAATAAAASSSRITSVRKDALEESPHQENLLKMNLSSGRTGFHSQLMPRAKETNSRLAISRVLSERHSDIFHSTDFSKEHPRSCDICRRSETLLNAILVCSSCKVAVHLDCYRSVKDSTGPWLCELCEELLSSRCSGVPAVNSWEKPIFIAECGICGGTTGAFRKSTGTQWIHAFCAEWVFESTFRRGQINPVEGMETVSKGNDFCCICRHKKGICIKCNYGNCQSTFHPSCARSAGFYMNSRAGGTKLQHKAYCEKHSLEQRAKAESQKHGIEELKSVKQIRVELERLRLLCERIVKREKLKRELVLCSHDILASKRDSVALSVLVRSPFFPPDVSSESATTSLKGHTDGYKSCSEAIQRSDDITVDSTVSVKHHMKPTASMDNDQKTDDSSTSHQTTTRKPAERMPFSGKQIPHRSSSVASRNHSDDGDKRTKSRRHTETFEKELVMTSDQASMKNQRLPKGFVYVPVGCLSNDKQMDEDVHSRDQLDGDG